MTEPVESETPEETQKEEEELSAVDKASKLVAEMKAENDRFEKFLDRQEELKTNMMLSGKAEAGNQEPSEEQKATESAKNLIKGSGFEDELFK
jgi:hypothetical protein|tara:strand:+ start:1507 stop:1785 length:279 start_codon:yes stop_codon:yes gene_type:complete